ncbi:MAG: 2TM domain-containing protein [Bacteroidota bacterium]
MSDHEKYQKAKKKVAAKKGFYLHFGIYIIVILFLAFINFMTNDRTDDAWWFLFPAASWAVAIGIHALSVFIFSGDGLLGEEWEARKIEEELHKAQGQSFQNQLPSARKLDMDEHLDLREVKKVKRYDEQDLV